MTRARHSVASTVRAMRKVSLRISALAWGALLVACGLDVAGIAPAGSPDVPAIDGGGPGVPDALGPDPDAGTAPTDASDDAPVLDSDSDSGCPAIAKVPPDGGARRAVIARAATANGPDAGPGAHVFRECPSFVLDRSTAAFVHGSPKASATVFMEWEPSALWIRFDVADESLAGTDPLPFQNDSVEIYVSSDPNRTQSYGVFDHQVIADYRGVGLHSTNGTQKAYDAIVVTKTASGYRAVIRMDASFFGGGFGSGATLYADALLSDGLQQVGYLIWAQEPHGPPASTYPSGDPRLFSPVTLE